MLLLNVCEENTWRTLKNMKASSRSRSMAAIRQVGLRTAWVKASVCLERSRENAQDQSIWTCHISQLIDTLNMTHTPTVTRHEHDTFTVVFKIEPCAHGFHSKHFLNMYTRVQMSLCSSASILHFTIWLDGILQAPGFDLDLL